MRMPLFGLVVVAVLAVTLAPVGAAESTVTGMLVEAGCGSNFAEGQVPDAEHTACMVRCASNGDAVGIMTPNGLYTITGAWAADKNAKLIAFMAQQVTATGVVTETDGRRMLEVSTLAAADGR